MTLPQKCPAPQLCFGGDQAGILGDVLALGGGTSLQLREEKAVYIGRGGVFPAVLSRVSTSEPSSFFVRGGIWRDRLGNNGQREREKRFLLI